MSVPNVFRHKSALAGLGLVAVLGGASYAAAAGRSASPDPVWATTPAAATAAAGATSTPSARGGGARSLLRRADHASIELDLRGEWVTYDLDRGTVTSVSPASITLSRPDGRSVTEAIGSRTRFRGVSSAAGVEVGRPATVVSEDGVTVSIRQEPPGARSGAGAGLSTTGGGQAGDQPLLAQ